MFERDNWQEIFATVRKNKLRTSLTMLGVFWGIFMLVIMLGAGNGLSNGVNHGFKGLSKNSCFFWAQKTNKPYMGFKSGRNYNFNNADVLALEQLPMLEVVSPQNQLGGYRGSNKVIRGSKASPLLVMGVYPNISRIKNIEIESGRFLNENDMKEFRKVGVIGPRVKEVLFNPDENPIGKYIQVNGVYFMVIGITKKTQGDEDGHEDAEKISIPFSTFQKTFNYGDIVGWFAILAKPSIKATDAEKIVLSKLKERHKVAPDDLAAVGHWNMGAEFEKINGLFTGISVLVWIVGTGTLFAGIIGISNIMLIIVKERTKEIGVKRALGATPFHIVSQILLESLFLTSLAGYLGLTSGIYILEALNKAMGDGAGMFRNPTVDLKVAVYALMAIIVGGLAAGFIPARKAIAISPVEALRTE